jgi:hypothetical protein
MNYLIIGSHKVIWKGKFYDLSNITEAKADELIASGFKGIKKVEKKETPALKRVRKKRE